MSAVTTSLELRMAHLEYDLSECAAIPVIGSPFAVFKIAIGIIQAVCALLVVIFTLIPSLWSKNAQEKCERGCIHLANGIANAIGGAFEAIPIIGLMLTKQRERRLEKGSKESKKLKEIEDDKYKAINAQQHMFFVGYNLLSKDNQPVGSNPSLPILFA